LPLDFIHDKMSPQREASNTGGDGKWVNPTFFIAITGNNSLLRIRFGEIEMKTEFALAFKQVLNEKNLPEEIIIEALQDAMVSAYRRSVNASSAQKVEAETCLLKKKSLMT